MTHVEKRYGVIRAARDYPGLIMESPIIEDKIFLLMFFWVCIPLIGLFGTRWEEA